MEFSPRSSVASTISAQRWSVRILALPYYLAIGPFLYDLFVHGVRWRSFYFFVYVVLSVAGLQIGYKESDFWVKIWFWTNILFIALVTGLAFFSKPFAQFVALYPWEKWVHFALLILLTLFFPLRFMLARKPMKSLDEEEEEEELHEHESLPSAHPVSPPPAPQTMPPIDHPAPSAPPT